MSTLLYPGLKIPYLLKPSRRRRTLGLRVGYMQMVTVMAPERFSRPSIDRFLRARAGWVIEKLTCFAEMARKYPPKEYVSGERFFVKGRPYRLKVMIGPIHRRPSVKFHEGRLLIFVHDQRKVREAMRRWYEGETEQFVRDAVQRLSPRAGVTPSHIHISNQKRQWANCSQAGDLRFNWRVAMMPGPVLDYVVAHELAHMKVHNHSAEFWSTVRSILPNYEIRRAWLRANGLQFAVA